MPELPEVETVVKFLQHNVRNKTINKIVAHREKIIKNIEPSKFTELLVGKTILDVSRRGKFIIFNLGDLSLISHLRMEGKYNFYSSDHIKEKHDHIFFYFDDDTVLIYNDSRVFGTMELVTTSEIEQFKSFQKLGPEPFEESLNAKYVHDKLSTSRKAIKTRLLDQSVFVGLGNIYVDEALHLSRISPERPSNKITLKESEVILKNSIDVLSEAIKMGGSTIKSYNFANNHAGSFQQKLNVYGKSGSSCSFNCGEVIIKTKLNGRGTHWCIKCQK